MHIKSTDQCVVALYDRRLFICTCTRIITLKKKRKLECQLQHYCVHTTDRKGKEEKRKKRVVGEVAGDDLIIQIQLCNAFGIETAPSRRAQRILKDLNETASSFHVTRRLLALFGGVSNKPSLLFSLISRARAASRVCTSSSCFCLASLRNILLMLDEGFGFSVSGAPPNCSSVLLLELLLSCCIE